jgi:FtsK/SpoIIIE family
MTRPRQIRRQARKLSRSGIQPMMMLSSGDQLPETAAVVIFRWAWRYRSELGPVFIAAATMLVAAVLHVAHPIWPGTILAITTPTAAGLAAFGQRIGLGSLAERLYAAAVIASDGGWLTAAMVAGPLRSPLPEILIIGAFVLAIPWWISNRRRARVRVERKLQAWPEIAQSVGLAGSRVMSAIVDVWGWRARFGLARGQTIADVLARLPAIESALGAVRGAARVYPTPDNLAHRFELRVLEMDPHADAIPWPGPSVATIAEPIDLGPFEDAAPARVLLLRRHALIGGIAGSGKSGGINVLMGNLSACRDVVIWAIDLKRGMELQPWASCIDRLATTPAQARMLLRDAVAILEARAALLTATGQRVWVPSPDMPALIIVIDEYAELADDTPEATAYSDSIARRGRAVAVTLIAATQRPTQKAMGKGAVRSQMDVRICFRVRERKDVDLILGQGMLTSGWQAHTLNAPGKFLVSAPEHDIPRRARAYLLTDEMVTATAGQHAEIRPALDEVSRQAVQQARTAIASPTAETDGQDDQGEADGDPVTILWAALSVAPKQGVAIGDLVQATRMSRPWVYQRLRELAGRRQVAQVSRGRWRAVTDNPQ